MSETPEPTDILASLPLDAVLYEMFRTTTDQSAIVTCTDAVGKREWATTLKATMLEVKEGLLRMEESGLVAVVEGLHKRSGRPAYGYIYTLSPRGRVLQEDYHFKPDKVLAVLERDGLRYEFSDTRGSYSGILVCRGGDGVVRWWRRLSTSDIGLEEATLLFDDDQIAVEAYGSHSRGGEWCCYEYRVTPGGTMTRAIPLKFLR